MDGGGAFSISEKLGRLRSYRDSWLTLQWKQKEDLAVSSLWLTDITSGCVVEPYGWDESVDNDGIEDQTGFISLVRLPGISRGISSMSWKYNYGEHMNLDGGKVSTVALDMLQDLLVLLSYVHPDSTIYFEC